MLYLLLTILYRFYSVILYPCIREALFENKKLSYYHYMALKKALFKPGAFYKGFLLPLCEVFFSIFLLLVDLVYV